MNHKRYLPKCELQLGWCQKRKWSQCGWRTNTFTCHSIHLIGNHGNSLASVVWPKILMRSVEKRIYNPIFNHSQSDFVCICKGLGLWEARAAFPSINITWARHMNIHSMLLYLLEGPEPDGLIPVWVEEVEEIKWKLVYWRHAGYNGIELAISINAQFVYILINNKLGQLSFWFINMKND